MARLPNVGGDDGAWGAILNDYLSQAHGPDGTLKPAAVSSALPDASATTKGAVQLAGDLAGTAAAPTVPALASKYVKPPTGIPETDLDVAVQTKLNAADTGTDAHVAGYVNNSGSATSAALSAAYVTRGAGVASIVDMPRPVVMAHRAAGMLAPENSLAGIRFASALPAVAIVDSGDLRSTKDGAVILNHDATLDARSSLSGNVSDWSLASLLRGNVLDASAWFGGGWPDQPICTLEQMLAEVGGKVYVALECKDAGAVTRTLEAIERMGIGPSIVWIHATTATAALGLPLGCMCVTFRSISQIAGQSAAALISELQGAGIEDIQVEHGSDMAKIDALIAAGLRVTIYNLYRHYEVAMYAGKDIFGVMVNDPIYTPYGATPATYRRTTASWPLTGTWGAGMLNAGNNYDVSTRGQFIGSAGAYRWQPNASTSYLLVGELCPVANPTAHTITVPITYDALGSDLTKWGGVFFGAPTDLAYLNQSGAGRNGYNLILRGNGDAALYRVTDGVATQIGSTSAAADLTAGATVTLTIAVAATTITVTRSDGGPAINVTDSTYRGGYIHLGMLGYEQAMRVSFGALAVS